MISSRPIDRRTDCVAEQAILDHKAKPSLMAKLALGVVELLERGQETLRNGNIFHHLKGEPFDKDPDISIRSFWMFQITFHRSVAFWYSAQAEWDSEHRGVAIRYLESAIEHVSPAHMPPLKGQLKALEADLQAFRGELNSSLQTYQHENNSIYYDAVPASDSVAPLPKGVVMMKPDPYPEPNLVPLQFAASEGDIAAAASGSNKTDEELARELQEQLNVGDGGGSVIPSFFAAAAEPAPPPSSNAPPSYEAVTAQPSPQAASLVEMGFPLERVNEALKKHNNDVDAALSSLIASS